MLIFSAGSFELVSFLAGCLLLTRLALGSGCGIEAKTDFFAESDGCSMRAFGEIGFASTAFATTCGVTFGFSAGLTEFVALGLEADFVEALA